MRKLQILALTLIFYFVATWPQARVSAVKLKRDPATYAPGEIIVKLTAGAPELNAEDLDGRAISIASVVGHKAGRDEGMRPQAASKRIDEIISRRGLDRM